MPKDETQFAVALADGRPVVTVLERGATAPVVFTATEAFVEALRTGELSLNVGFMQGRIKAAGDMKELFQLLGAAPR